MTKLYILVLLGALVAVANGQDNVNRVPPEPPSPKPPTPAPTEPTTTKPPPTEPPTKPTLPPTQPPTTKPAPPTTQPTTPKPTNSPTTPKPTIPPPPPPTPKPTPPPEPPKPVDPTTGTWQVNYPNSNNSCLLVQFALQIEIPYHTTSNKTNVAHINIPVNATASGLCENKTQSVILQWNEDNNTMDKIIVNFDRNITTKKYELKNISVVIVPDGKNFPGRNDTTPFNLLHNHEEFRTSLTKSYRCAKKQELNLTDNSEKEKLGTIVVSHLQFEAFANTTNKQFSSAEDCATSDTPDVVPIAVGCALAALVIIVLIAYLIGRRRRQARGYLSM